MKVMGRPGMKIICINDGYIYPSLEAAANHYNIARSSLSKQLKGKRATVGGLHFIYDDDSLTDEEIKKLRSELLEQIYGIKNL